MRTLFSIAVISVLSVNVLSNESCNQSGIRGHVYRVQGNQMPSPDVKPSGPKGLKTTVYIFPLTNLSQVTRDANSAFYHEIKTKLITKIETDEQGAFQTKLPPGFYSLFVKKGDLYYANIYDDRNNIYPVEVKKNNWSEVDFRADYDATY